MTVTAAAAVVVVWWAVVAIPAAVVVVFVRLARAYSDLTIARAVF